MADFSNLKVRSASRNPGCEAGTYRDFGGWTCRAPNPEQSPQPPQKPPPSDPPSQHWVETSCQSFCIFNNPLPILTCVPPAKARGLYAPRFILQLGTTDLHTLELVSILMCIAKLVIGWNNKK